MIDLFFAPASKEWFIIQVMCNIYLLFQSIASYVDYSKDSNRSNLIIYWFHVSVTIAVGTRTVCLLAGGGF